MLSDKYECVTLRVFEGKRFEQRVVKILFLLWEAAKKAIFVISLLRPLLNDKYQKLLTAGDAPSVFLDRARSRSCNRAPKKSLFHQHKIISEETFREFVILIRVLKKGENIQLMWEKNLPRVVGERERNVEMHLMHFCQLLLLLLHPACICTWLCYFRCAPRQKAQNKLICALCQKNTRRFSYLFFVSQARTPDKKQQITNFTRGDKIIIKNSKFYFALNIGINMINN